MLMSNPYPVVEFLRALGHDVLTVQEAGNANQRTSDPDILAFATSENRAVITQNRKDFFRLHRIQPDHAGISLVRTTVIGRRWLTESTLQLQRKNLCKGN